MGARAPRSMPQILGELTAWQRRRSHGMICPPRFDVDAPVRRRQEQLTCARDHRSAPRLRELPHQPPAWADARRHQPSRPLSASGRCGALIGSGHISHIRFRSAASGSCRFGILVAAYLGGHTTQSCTLVTRSFLFRRASSVAAELSLPQTSRASSGEAVAADTGHATPATLRRSCDRNTRLADAGA
jgi:hypothetical protein